MLCLRFWILPEDSGSQNYFLLIGDWGRADSPGPCQRAVADHMHLVHVFIPLLEAERHTA